MTKDKKFAWFPLMTDDKELVWLKSLSVKEKCVKHKYQFTIFGGETSLELEYTKNIFSKIK